MRDVLVLPDSLRVRLMPRKPRDPEQPLQPPAELTGYVPQSDAEIEALLRRIHGPRAPQPGDLPTTSPMPQEHWLLRLLGAMGVR